MGSPEEKGLYSLEYHRAMMYLDHNYKVYGRRLWELESAARNVRVATQLRDQIAMDLAEKELRRQIYIFEMEYIS